MKISRFNHEGYHDPTPYLAFQNIPDPAKEAEKEKQRRDRLARYRPIVYICSPYAGDVKANVLNARRYCRFAVQKDCIPIASHLFFPQFMDDNDAKQRDLGLYMATVLLTKCSEVWVFGRRISSGMAAEIYKAETRGMPIPSRSSQYTAQATSRSWWEQSSWNWKVLPAASRWTRNCRKPIPARQA